MLVLVTPALRCCLRILLQCFSSVAAQARTVLFPYVQVRKAVLSHFWEAVIRGFIR
jgi:hypothetical protein